MLEILRSAQDDIRGEAAAFEKIDSLLGRRGHHRQRTNGGVLAFGGFTVEIRDRRTTHPMKSWLEPTNHVTRRGREI